MEKESQTIFDKNVIEFVTVAAEFCAFLERAAAQRHLDDAAPDRADGRRSDDGRQ